MMRHVMMDLETWGLIPGSDIRSIGAVVFDPIAGTLGDEFHVAVENPTVSIPSTEPPPRCGPRYPLVRDPNTVQFWFDQPAEAQLAFDNPIDLANGLLGFAHWLGASIENGPKNFEYPAIALWSNGPHFDEAILAACYRAVGLPVPWHYRAPRDCRTIWEAAGGINLPFEGVQHNALDDAKHQARCVIEAYRRIGQGLRA